MTKEDKILLVKESIAISYGYPNNILGNAWDYAMMITHRRKAQIKLYEEVCFKLLEK